MLFLQPSFAFVLRHQTQGSCWCSDHTTAVSRVPCVLFAYVLQCHPHTPLSYLVSTCPIPCRCFEDFSATSLDNHRRGLILALPHVPTCPFVFSPQFASSHPLRLFSFAAITGREITMSALREWAATLGPEARAAVAVNNLGKWKTATQVS